MNESREATVDATLLEILGAFQKKEIDFDTAYQRLDDYMYEQMAEQDRITQSYMSNQMNSLRGEVRKLKAELKTKE